MDINSGRDLATHARAETLKTELLDLLVSLADKYGVDLDEEAKKHMYKYIDYLINKLNLGEESTVSVERIIVVEDSQEPLSYVRYEEVIDLVDKFKSKMAIVLLDLINYELEKFLMVGVDR